MAIARRFDLAGRWLDCSCAGYSIHGWRALIPSTELEDLLIDLAKRLFLPLPSLAPRTLI